MEPRARRHLLAPHAAEEVPRAQRREERPDPDHRLKRDPHDVDRRLVGLGHGVEALHLGVRVVERQQRQALRDRDPVLHLAVVVPAAERQRRAALGVADALERGELRRLGLRDLARRPVADDELHRRGERRDRQRDRQRDPLVAAPAPAQPPDRVRARHEEARDDEPREVHVHELVGDVRVAEQRLDGIDVGDLAVDEGEAAGVVHPRVDRQHEQRAGHPREHDRKPAEEVRARRHAVPAVDVDPDEDRLDEEREPLEREAQPEDRAERAHEAGPQQAHLEAQDRAGHDAAGEQRDHDLRPAHRQHAVDLVAGAQPEPLGAQHHRRKRDPEAHERDVDGERQRLHLARLEQIGLLHGVEHPATASTASPAGTSAMSVFAVCDGSWATDRGRAATARRSC